GRDLVVDLVAVVALARKLLGHALPHRLYRAGDAFAERPAGERHLHALHGVGPERRAHLFVDAAVAEDAELAIARGHVDQDGVAIFGLGQPQPREQIGRALVGVAAGAARLDMYLDLAG